MKTRKGKKENILWFGYEVFLQRTIDHLVNIQCQTVLLRPKQDQASMEYDDAHKSRFLQLVTSRKWRVLFFFLFLLLFVYFFRGVVPGRSSMLQWAAPFPSYRGSIKCSFFLRILHHVQNIGRITPERKRPGSTEHNSLFLVCD